MKWCLTPLGLSEKTRKKQEDAGWAGAGKRIYKAVAGVLWDELTVVASVGSYSQLSIDSATHKISNG